MRIILFTGKGGVGKTSVAAATALRCSQLGHKTFIYSTDAAHSLSDSFGRDIGCRKATLAANLYAQEIDVNDEIRKNWGPIKDFIENFIASRGMDSVIADEMAVFPGMEELFCLLEVKAQYDRADCDVIIIDCAPTGETLRLLAGPDIAKWYMEKLFQIERTVMKAVRPVARHLIDIPLPGDDVYRSMEMLYRNLEQVKAVLTDRDVSSMRIVLNPEKMVIKESQRAYTFLNLFGYMVDAVVANRLLPDEVRDPYYREWKKIQKAYMEDIGQCFFPLPLLTCRFRDREVVGFDLLERMAEEIYGDEDPSRIYHREQPFEVSGSDGSYRLLLQLPFADKKDLDLWVKSGELIIQYRNFKRNFTLPRALASLPLRHAQLTGKRLTITFGRDRDG